MKYQAIQHLKTKTKLLKICDTLIEAHDIIMAKGARYEGRSYYGGFPRYSADSKIYSIQGAHFLTQDDYVVCSLDNKEIETFYNNQ